MRRLPVLIGLVCASCAVVWAQGGVLTTSAALETYARGDRSVISKRANGGLPPVWTIAEDLARLPKSTMLPTATMAESSREIAAFAIEAARTLETQSPTSVCPLINNTRTRWMPAGTKTEFARRWHIAALATMLRNDCVAAANEAVTAALADFPAETRFRLIRAMVGEQQLAAAFANGDRPSGRDLRDAETRFKIAMALPQSAAEASLRWARVNAQLGQHEQAISLAAEAMASKEVRLRYLAHLFRGWSLAALEKFSDADIEYGNALALVPDAQSASLARAAAAFRHRAAERSGQAVDALISRTNPVEDPWWTYSIGDGRLVDQAILELRQVIR